MALPYNSTLKSDTDDGAKGKRSLETHGTDVGDRTTHFTNETIHSDFGNVTYLHSTHSEDHDTKSDYKANHDFTLDAQGQQSAEGGKLKSDFVTTANNNHHANDDRVEGYALPGDGYHSTKTHNEYDRDVYSHQEIHDQGVYSGTLQGDGDYSRRQGARRQWPLKCTTAKTRPVFHILGVDNGQPRDGVRRDLPSQTGRQACTALQ